ncbi:hypothetical protein [Desulfopila inferna]|uniref:hypothetical protein n=1 Tax=Desulfopila inferna TaxID=468528 RepID=UPI001965A33F|nr:hypothetical protein [Desulfopila inferna]
MTTLFTTVGFDNGLIHLHGIRVAAFSKSAHIADSRRLNGILRGYHFLTAARYLGKNG